MLYIAIQNSPGVHRFGCPVVRSIFVIMMSMSYVPKVILENPQISRDTHSTRECYKMRLELLYERNSEYVMELCQISVALKRLRKKTSVWHVVVNTPAPLHPRAFPPLRTLCRCRLINCILTIPLVSRNLVSQNSGGGN